MNKTYSVYIMASRSGTLYIGVTNDLDRRVHEHKHGLVPGFTSKYRVSRLVYCEHTNDVAAAIEREKQLKRWSRQKKIALIESVNPQWEDLSAEKSNKSRLAARDPSASVGMTERQSGWQKRPATSPPRTSFQNHASGLTHSVIQKSRSEQRGDPTAHAGNRAAESAMVSFPASRTALLYARLTAGSHSRGANR